MAAAALLIAIVLAGYARQIKDDTFRLVFEKMTDEKVPSGDLAKAIDLVQATSEQQQADLVTGMLLSAIEGLDVSYLTQLCKQHKLDVAKHWKLDKTFLELLTKAEMMVVADEIGLRVAMGDDFKKVFSKSKSEVIEALLNVSGFEYAGKIPKVLKF